jgi:uncharacterized protein (TIGR02453 family)
MARTMASHASRFSGFDPKALRLLAALAKHNDRAWFAPRKARFESELLAPLVVLVEDATVALTRAKIPIGGDRKRSIFRIYRDVRFSSDKSPYKTHVSAYLSYDGGRKTPGGIYIHIQPKESFLSIAFYRIEKPMLARWRASMAADPARFTRVLRALEKHRLRLIPPEDDEDSLARMPRGFEAHASSPLAPYFRLRNFCTHVDLDDREVTSPTLLARIVDLARAAKPLLEFGWSLD